MESALPTFEEALAVATKLDNYNQQLKDLVNAIDMVLHNDSWTEHEQRQFESSLSDMKVILCYELPWLLSDVAQYYRKIADLLTTGVPPQWYCDEHPDWREKQIQMVTNHMSTM